MGAVYQTHMLSYKYLVQEQELVKDTHTHISCQKIPGWVGGDWQEVDQKYATILSNWGQS